jgi:hypothetical protein
MFLHKQALANAVISLVQFRMSTEFDTLVVEPYINGRECGWSLAKFGETHTPKVSFSENRSSDEIVVYSGRMQDFKDGNIPQEHIYKAAKYFEAVEIWQAVDRIINHLNS